MQFKTHQIIQKKNIKNMLLICRKSKAHPLCFCERAMCCLWLHAVLSCALCGKKGGPIGYALTICPPIGQAVSLPK